MSKFAALLAALLLPFLSLHPTSAASAAAGTLRVAFNYQSAPYRFINEDYSFSGLHIDIMNWIAKEKQYEVIYKPYADNTACLNALRAHEADIVLGHRTDDLNAADFEYSDEISASSLCLVAAAENKDRIVKSNNYRAFRAAIEYGSTRYIYLEKMNTSSYMALGNQEAVFEALRAGKVDMALMLQDSYQYLSRKAGVQRQYAIVRDYITPVSYAMVTLPGRPELKGMLNAGLAEIRTSGNYQKIYDRWILSENGSLSRLTLRRIYIGLGSALFLAALATVIFYTMNRVLKRRVEQKTGELRHANAELDRHMVQLKNENSIRFGMIEYSPTAMVSFDSTYRILLMNRAAVAMSGIDDDATGRDVRGLPVFGSLLKEIRADIFSMPLFLTQRGQPVLIQLRGPSGTRVYRYSLYCSRDDQSISSILLAVEDVTREDERNRALFEQEKNATLNRLVAGIAHEMRNPLMAIRTASSLLRTQWDDPGVREAFVRFVPEETDRINHLIESLINYARPVKGECKALRLSEVIGECQYLTTIAAKKRQIHCKTDLDEDVWIHANHDQIKQSLINIIINGIESLDRKIATGFEKPLTLLIRVWKEGDQAVILVRDEGMGMDPEDARRCTEPFFTTKPAGTGLGLALVEQFIRKNDGTLFIDSNPGSHTAVEIKFQRIQPEKDHEKTHSDH